MKHDNNFNLLRLLAAAQVVYVHASGDLHLPTLIWPDIIIGQFPGVACFFVISGFLVTESCRRSTTADFFKKRALRIYPALVAFILTMEALMWATGGLVILSGFYFIVYLPTYLFTASTWIAWQLSMWALDMPKGVSVYVPAYFQQYPSGVLWTLTVELSFYLVLPLFMFVVNQVRTMGIAMIVVAAVASFKFVCSADAKFHIENVLVDITIAPYFWTFAIGVLARLYWDDIRWWIEGHFLFWAALYAATLVAAWQFGAAYYLDFKIPSGVIDLVRTVILAGLLLSAAYSFKSLTKLLRIDENDFSYGLYLWHMVAIDICINLALVEQWWLWPVVFAASLAFAAASWFLIEQHFDRRKNLSVDADNAGKADDVSGRDHGRAVVFQNANLIGERRLPNDPAKADT